MITDFDNKYIDQVYILGKELNPKFDVLYDELSLNKDCNHTYLLVRGEKLIGFIHIQDLVDEIDIIDIIIDKTYRHKGYASKLLDYILDIKDSKKIILEVDVNNIPAINLYHKYNFIEINRRKKYYNGSDAIIMEKK